MDTLYQSLVTVNPVTLIAQICNLFIQLLQIFGMGDDRRN